MSFTKGISQLGLACKFYGTVLGGFEDTFAVIKLNAIGGLLLLECYIHKLYHIKPFLTSEHETVTCSK